MSWLKNGKIAAVLAAWPVQQRPEWRAVYEGLERHQQADGKDKKLVGVGGYAAYPTETKIRDWAEKGSTLKKALVRDDSATLVGVGVVHNTDLATKDRYPIMVVVMTY